MAKAFVTGGAICTLGQVIMNFGRNMGMGKEVCGSITSISLILLSVLLTGWNIYPRVAKWGGAGALVPITGFANSVAAPAIEYKKEGQVMGIGCKIFYHCRSRDLVRCVYKLDIGACLLDLETVGINKRIKGGRLMIKGKQSLEFEQAPYLTFAASVAGKKEGEGPLGALFDFVETEDLFGESTWEAAESAMQKICLFAGIRKGRDRAGRCALSIRRDLLRQGVATSMGVESLGIPMFGLYAHVLLREKR